MKIILLFIVIIISSLLIITTFITIINAVNVDCTLSHFSDVFNQSSLLLPTNNITLSTEHQYTLAYLIYQGKLFIQLKAQTNGWIGFGLSERGHMLGSDIVTVSVGENGVPDIKDRFVSWVAYPFANESDGRPFPTIDSTCQDWSSLCAVEQNGFTSAVLVRSLSTNDEFDRNITNQDQSIVWAISAGGANPDQVAYHTGSNRGSTRINFFVAPLSSTGNAAFIPPVDTTNFQDIYFTWITTAQDTVYSRKSFDFGTIEYHAIGYEFLWISPYAKQHIHHTILHDCGNTTGYPWTASNGSSAIDGNTLSGGGGGGEDTCRTSLYVGSRGSENQIMPENVGFRVGGRFIRYTMLEMHIDNPDKIVGRNVTGGVRVHLTTTFRQHNAGMMHMGFANGATIPAGQSRVVHVNTCAKECTNTFNGPITVFQSFLHAHATAREMWTEKFSQTGESQGIMNQNQYWNSAFQTATRVNYVLNPGEVLNTWCTFDTSKKTDGVSFGPSSAMEMCYDFISFFPAENGKTQCSRNGALAGSVNCGVNDVFHNAAPEYAPNLNASFPAQFAVGGYSYGDDGLNLLNNNNNRTCSPMFSTQVPTMILTSGAEIGKRSSLLLVMVVVWGCN
jgi:hypothetical protein